jgi:hypothetical protein
MKGRWAGRFSNLIGSWDDEHGHWDKKWPVATILAFLPIGNLVRETRKASHAMDRLLNDICVLVTAAFVVRFLPGLRLGESPSIGTGRI